MAARTHRVEWGETWYGIAREYRLTPRDLAAANPTVDPEHLRSGEVLRIPRTAAAAGARSHRVVAGETLWGISRRYGVAAAEVRRLNRMPDDKVRTGQLLIIPQEDTRR
jgi:LysM repeat protein